MKRRLVNCLATGGGIGYCRYASGTLTTMVVAPFWVVLAVYGSGIVYGVVLVGVTVIGCWAVSEMLRSRVPDGRDDPSEIVMDEIVGCGIACAPLISPTLFWGVVAVVFFRVLDIAKPGPVGWADRRVKGMWGVMLDDVLAGVLALLGVLVLRWVI